MVVRRHRWRNGWWVEDLARSLWNVALVGRLWVGSKVGDLKLPCFAISSSTTSFSLTTSSLPGKKCVSW